MDEETKERSLALTPTWSVASVLSMFVAVSLLLERSIHHLLHQLHRSNRRPLLQAVEKMKEELMLLGFISLLLTATSSTISSICIESKLYNSVFAPCSRSDIDKDPEDKTFQERKLSMASLPDAFRRSLNELNQKTCEKGYEPFVSEKGLEQLDRFIFILAVTHLAYSCLTMLLAIIKVNPHLEGMGRSDSYYPTGSYIRYLQGVYYEKAVYICQISCCKFFGREQLHTLGYVLISTIRALSVMFRLFNTPPWLHYVHGQNHHLASTYDFHSYMVRSMEEEFQRIVGVSTPLWAFVVAFMLFDIHGSNLYFWMAIIPMALLLMVGTKLQHVIATLTLESTGKILNPRDDLFWFKKPELLLSLIHFILFQNAFELASFLWFWWQFGYRSCFMRHHFYVYLRLAIGFLGQVLCSCSTLPLYALVTQMGTNYKAAMIPRRVRETLHGLNKSARRKRRLGQYDGSTPGCSETFEEEDDDDEEQNYSNDTKWSRNQASSSISNRAA